MSFCAYNQCWRPAPLLQVCLVGKSRTYKQSDEAEIDQRRASYIQSRQTFTGAAVQRSGVRKGRDCCHCSVECDDTSGSAWGDGFQPRNGAETVRNCAALPRDVVDGVVQKVAEALLGMSEGTSSGDWNKGGKQKQQQQLLDDITLNSNTATGKRRSNSLCRRLKLAGEETLLTFFVSVQKQKQTNKAQIKVDLTTKQWPPKHTFRYRRLAEI